MTKWQYLFEGKALGPATSVRKAADTLTKYIGDTIEDWYNKGFGKIDDERAFAKYLKKLEKLLAEKDDISIGRRSDPYGKKRIKLIYEIVSMRGTATAVTGILDPKDLDPKFIAYKKAGFKFVIYLRLSEEELGNLSPDTMRYFLSPVREALIHEFTHTLDPKNNIKYIKKMEKHQTRKPYKATPIAPKTLTPSYDTDFERYVNSPVEQETWTRGLARRLIYKVYEKTKSVEAVDQMTRKPPRLTGYGMKYGEQDKTVLSVWRKNPKRWKRFLRTLRDEYEIFAKDPTTYMRYGHYT